MLISFFPFIYIYSLSSQFYSLMPYNIPPEFQLILEFLHIFSQLLNPSIFIFRFHLIFILSTYNVRAYTPPLTIIIIMILIPNVWSINVIHPITITAKTILKNCKFSKFSVIIFFVFILETFNLRKQVTADFG